jgi:hypothetical protein
MTVAKKEPGWRKRDGRTPDWEDCSQDRPKIRDDEKNGGPKDKEDDRKSPFEAQDIAIETMVAARY